jgi:hypothetical protein
MLFYVQKAIAQAVVDIKRFSQVFRREMGIVSRHDLKMHADLVPLVSCPFAQIGYFATEEVLLIKQADFFQNTGAHEKNGTGNMIDWMRKIIRKFPHIAVQCRIPGESVARDVAAAN